MRTVKDLFLKWSYMNRLYCQLHVMIQLDYGNLIFSFVQNKIKYDCFFFFPRETACGTCLNELSLTIDPEEARKERVNDKKKTIIMT